jgi:tetratricopeptide (TPR) repeat protein
MARGRDAIKGNPTPAPNRGSDRTPVSGTSRATMKMTTTTPRRGIAIAVALLVAACVLTYIGSLRGDFVSDDVLLRNRLREVVAEGGWSRVLRTDLVAIEAGARTGFYRPLATLSLLIDGAISGDSPAGYHVTNIVLHIAATLLVLLLALQLGLALQAATAAALLFAVHPVHVEAVAWISGRFDLLCTAFYLLALWLYARAVGRRSGAVFAAAVAAGAAAMLAKEMAVTLPAVVFLLDAVGLARGDPTPSTTAVGFWRPGWRGALVRSIPFAAVVAGYFLLRSASRETEILMQPGDALPRLELVSTAGRAVLYYFGLLLFPIELRAFATIPPVTQPLNAYFLAGVAALAAAAALAWRWRRTRPVAAFGILFVLVSLVPVSNIIGFYPLAKARFPVAERYLYLPSAGFVLAIAVLLWGWARRRASGERVFVGAVTVLALAGAVRSVARVPVWRTQDTLFETTARQSPRDPWAHYMLGSVRHGTGRLAAARSEFETALQLDPRFFAATLEMAGLCMSQRQYADAERWYRRAVHLEPRSEDARMGLARTLHLMGRLPEASVQYDSMAVLGARDSRFLTNRGELRLATGDLDAAKRDFDAAIAANPRRKEAHHNLGVVHHRRGRYDDAQACAQRALAIDPNYGYAYMLLGSVAVAREDFATAARELESAVQADSTLVQARVNLGAAYLNLGDYAGAIAVLQDAVRRAPSGPAWTNLAEAQSRSGAVDAGIASFREALRLDPNLVAAQRGLGLLLAGRPADAAEARRLLQWVGASRPDDSEVKTALDRLSSGGRRH